MQAEQPHEKIVVPHSEPIPETADLNDPASLVCDNCGVKGDGMYQVDPYTKRAIHRGECPGGGYTFVPSDHGTVTPGPMTTSALVYGTVPIELPDRITREGDSSIPSAL